MVLYQRRAYRRGQEAGQAHQVLYDVLIARLNGLKLAKAFAIERQLEDDFARASEGLRRAEVSRGEHRRATLVQEVAAAALLGGLVYTAIAIFRVASLELVVLIMVFARLAPVGFGVQATLRIWRG